MQILRLNIFSFLLLMSCLAPAATSGIIFGRVIFTNGTPAENVVLNLNNTSIYGISDENGNYLIENVPYGTHAIIVKPFGGDIKVVNVELKSEKLQFGIELKTTSTFQQLEEVEVKAQSKSQVLKNSGYSVGLVETQQMALQSVQTMELLDRTAGVRIRQSGGMGSAFYNYTDNNYEVWGDQVFVSEPPTWSLQYVKARRFHDSYRS